MDILDVCIVNIISEQELAQTVRVVIDTDCWGHKERKTEDFSKAIGRKPNATRATRKTKYSRKAALSISRD